MIQNNGRITPKPDAHLQTMTKTPAKFQKDQLKTVRGVASTSYPSHCVYGQMVEPVFGFDPRRGRQHSFAEIDRKIFSMVIISLLLIQEGQLSVSGKSMCTILVNRLEH